MRLLSLLRGNLGSLGGMGSLYLLLLLQTELLLALRFGRDRRLLLHASRLKHVRPLSARAPMAVLEVLSEVIRTVEFLTLVALAEFVNVCQMLASCQPVRLRKVWKFFATVSANIERRYGARRVWRLGIAGRVRRGSVTRVEGSFEVAFERGARPRVSAKM